MSYIARSAFIVAASVIVGCSDSNPPPAVCSTDSAWLDGDSGSADMRPGGDCIGCHHDNGGPKLSVGGTVMNDLRDDDNCNGVEGVVVELTGADGAVHTLITNSAGNFLSTGLTIELPYSARVLYDGQTREMVAPQGNLDCNTCHTAAGDFDAPGRIVIPGVDIDAEP